MPEWTPKQVEERLEEAALVMKRLPPVRVPGYFNTWPKMVVEFADMVGQEPVRTRLPPPSPGAISQMEEALMWLRWLEPIDAKILWLRATGTRWKPICWQVGLERAAAHEHFRYALCVIAWRLNGRQKVGSLSRRSFIAANRHHVPLHR
jgi:hypothetical protein